MPFARRGRIAARFASLRAEGRGAFIPFLEAGDPDLSTSLRLLRALPSAGADLIELGIPFTDPMADGPTIQAAGRRALKAGTTLAKGLALVRDFRAADRDTPIILMGYLNPVLSYGVQRFCQDASASGVDGLILVDLPPEEAAEVAVPAGAVGLDIIRLIAPTTSEDRMKVVLEGSSGFVYYVSITGITGTGLATEAHLAEAIPRIRRHTQLPIAVGFGVKTPDDAAMVVRHADGAVVASSLIANLTRHLDAQGRALPSLERSVLDQIRALAEGIRAARAALSVSA